MVSASTQTRKESTKLLARVLWPCNLAKFCQAMNSLAVTVLNALPMLLKTLTVQYPQRPQRVLLFQPIRPRRELSIRESLKARSLVKVSSRWASLAKQTRMYTKLR